MYMDIVVVEYNYFRILRLYYHLLSNIFNYVNNLKLLLE